MTPAFDLPAATLAAWVAAGIPAASEEEIAAIAALTPHPLPSDYVAFLRTHGLVDWREVSASLFELPDGGQEGLGAMFAAVDMANLLDSPDFDIPDGLLPIMSDLSGHAILLVQTAPPAGTLFYSYDNAPAQEIAASFTAFVEGLASLGEQQFTRWTGTPQTDPETGFTIAAETRAAWATYGTGSAPEPADELAEIEATLGRPIPEALRTFLTTYGYVTYFGDVPASFDLPGSGQRAELSAIYSTAVLPRALPLAPGAPLPFASTGTDQGELLIGLTENDEGVIYWRPDPQMKPVPVGHDLRGFLAALYQEVPTDG